MKKIIYIITFFIFSGYYAGLAMIIAFGMSNFSRYYSIPLRLLMFVLMAYVIFKNANQLKRSPQNKSVFVVLILFWLLYLFKLLYHSNELYPLYRSSWTEYFFYALVFCIFPFFTYASIDFNKYKLTILNSLIFSGFVMGITSLYLYKEIMIMGVGRISDIKYQDDSAEVLSPIALSYAGVLTLVLCLFKIIYLGSNGFKDKLYIYATIILSLIMFFLGSSRGSMIALLTSAVLFILYGTIRVKNKAFFVFLLSVPVLIYGALLSGSNIFKRLGSTVDDGDTGRSDLWDAAWQEFINYPFWGNRIEIKFYPHNIFLEIMMATGIIGLILFLYILIKGYSRVIVYSRRDVGYLIPFIVLNQGLSQHMVTGALYISILVFFPLGILYSSNNSAK